MGLIRDSSELKEAARLVGGLLGPLKRKDAPDRAGAPPDAESPPAETQTVEAALPDYAECISSGTRPERIAAVLELLARRGGYDGAVLVDADGFVAASYGAGYGEQEVATLASSLGRCRKRMEDAFGDNPAGVMTASLGAARACCVNVETGGAVFLLAGLTGEGEPDAGELAAAARSIELFLGSGAE